jgi:hypothetical protein
VSPAAQTVLVALPPANLVELRFETYANDVFDYFVDDLGFF